MATGIYGNIRPADVDVKDIDILYTYVPDRTISPSIATFLPSSVISQMNHPTDTNRILGGLYNLKLPSTIFNKVGIYTIYIRPKEIKLTIQDCGVLAAKPDIKGIIFNLQNVLPEDLYRFENNGLIGYRVEFLNSQANISEKKIRNLSRIITSNFKVEPITDNLQNTTQKSIKYRIQESSTLVFCTVTPSSAFSLKPNVFPFIGNPGQSIIMSNTFFDPEAIEIQITKYDLDSIAIGLYGNQTKDVRNGVRTYYDENQNIYKQFNEYVIKDSLTSEELYEVKEEKTDIDFTEEFNRIKAQQ